MLTLNVTNELINNLNNPNSNNGLNLLISELSHTFKSCDIHYIKRVCKDIDSYGDYDEY